METEKFNFLLMGKTGQGKSATGNMLLNRRVFKTSSNFTSQTKEVDFSFAQFKDNILLVVDGPGLQDTDIDEVRDKELAVKNMDTALAMCCGGVNAFLFTIRVGTRFTSEELATLESLKRIFGEDYMKFLIVIVTCGDLFQQAMEEKLTDTSFKDWCKKQTGAFRQLYEKCNGRFVLFNNVTKVQQERESQIQQVISLTRALKYQYGTYTSQCFQNAEYERNKLIVELKAPELTSAIQENLSLLTAEMEEYSKQPSVIHKEQLVKRIQHVKEEIVLQDEGYNVLTDLVKTVKKVEENLSDVVELQRLAVELENTRKRREDTLCKQNEMYNLAVLENGGRECHDHTTEAEEKLVGNGNLQTESQSSRGCKRLALILSLTALLTCLAVLLYVTVVLATQITPRDHDKHIQATVFGGDQMRFQEVCLDYQRLVKNPYSQLRNDTVVEELMQRQEGNVLKYCAENRVQLSAMLKAVARRQDTLKDLFPATYRDLQKSSTVSVHKQMVSETWNSLTGYSVVKFDPSHNQGLGEQSRGATVLEDGIVILKTGTYYIYSNVFFNVNVTGKPSSNQKWSSHVHRTSPQWNSRTRILLTSVHTLCHNCKRDLITSFTGGVFQLQSGDFIQVFLSDVGLVYFNRKSSYLGLVMISK